MKYILVLSLFYLNVFALSPFSLEGFKETNIKVLTKKNKLISKEFKERLLKELRSQLEQSGIKTSSDLYSNFALKIESIKIDDKAAVNVSLFIVEDVIPSRDTTLENMGITYKRNDFFRNYIKRF